MKTYNFNLQSISVKAESEEEAIKKLKNMPITYKIRKLTKPLRKKCLKCEHEWWSRVNNPVLCPKCKRSDWKDNKKEIEKLLKGKH